MTRHQWAELTVSGAATMAAWRAAPGGTLFDRRLALRPANPLAGALPEAAAGRAAALAEARRLRPDEIAETVWDHLIEGLWDSLAEEQRRDAHEILHVALKRKSREDHERLRRQTLDELIRERSGLTVGRSLDKGAAELLRRRRPGRPGWTKQRVLEHWQEAYSEAMRQLGRPPSKTEAEGHFRALNGSTFLDPDRVRRLLRQYESGEIPE